MYEESTFFSLTINCKFHAFILLYWLLPVKNDLWRFGLASILEELPCLKNGSKHFFSFTITFFKFWDSRIFSWINFFNSGDRQLQKNVYLGQSEICILQLRQGQKLFLLSFLRFVSPFNIEDRQSSNMTFSSGKN